MSAKVLKTKIDLQCFDQIYYSIMKIPEYKVWMHLRSSNLYAFLLWVPNYKSSYSCDSHDITGNYLWQYYYICK